MRLAIVASHPIQYQAPLFRELAGRLDLTVLFAHRATRQDQAQAGFGVGFEWDVDLLGGYGHHFLKNVALNPGLHHFSGCDTPEIIKQLRRGAFDAVLVMGWHLKCFWQAIWAAKRLGIPVMVRGDSHLNTPRSLAKHVVKGIVYPVALRVFDAALYVGEQSRSYWEHYRYPKERLVFSPHCVDNNWFAARATAEAGTELRVAHGVSDDAEVLLFAGKLVPLKRPLDVVSAAGIIALAGTPATVLVAGAGPLADEMSTAARKLGVQLIHLGFCNQTDMPRAYAAASALVLPSDSETWGLVANEALACGTPIILSDACGCAPDLAGDGWVGRTFPVGNVEALAGAIQALLARPPSRELIAGKIRRYSPEAAADGVAHAVKVLRDGVDVRAER